MPRVSDYCYTDPHTRTAKVMVECAELIKVLPERGTACGIGFRAISNLGGSELD